MLNVGFDSILDGLCLEDQQLTLELFDLPLSDFPKLEYTIGDIKRAGKTLAENIFWHESSDNLEARKVFQIAQNWRESHALPMARVRSEIIGKVRKLKIKGMTAARLKRMKSIREKLRKISTNLNQIQDIAGCRIILPSISDVQKFINYYRENGRYEIKKEDNYITNPKLTGYRSHHMVLRFKSERDGEEIFNGRLVELQVRTRLQHAWSTAVEAIGTFRNENLKGGEGNKNWLRLFELTASELAFTENCPELSNAPIRKDRIQEIIELNEKLDAITTLDACRQAVKYTDTYIAENTPYLLIHYDNKSNIVNVYGYTNPIDGSKALEKSELNENDINIVLVSTDKISNLKKLYPNYFGDVKIFAQNLEKIVKGKQAIEYTMPQQVVVPRPPVQQRDLSWIRKYTPASKHKKLFER